MAAAQLNLIIYTNLDMFGMLIHSCFVDDGSGNNRFQISDQNG